MRATRLEVSDILGVRQVDLILPEDEPVPIIGGPNGGGKSSALNAFMMALVDAGGHPLEALRRGAAKGVIRVTFNDGMVVTRTIRRGKAPQLKVVDGDGEPMGVGAGGPQRGVLDKLYSKFTWDPTAALRLPKAELRQQLMQLAGIDWTDLERREQELVDDRRHAKRFAGRLRAQLDGMPTWDEPPAEPPDIGALQAERVRIRAHNAKGKQLRATLADAEQQTEHRRRQVAEIEEQIVELRRQLELAQRYGGEAQAKEREARIAAEDHEELPGDGIEQQIAQASETILEHERWQAREKHAAESRAAEAEVRQMTDEIEEIRRQKQEQLESAEFPVDGLGVSDEGVVYNGLPFEQAEESARLRVAVAIGMKLNPKMPTMICRYGGGLDEGGIELLKKIVAEGGGQLLLEHPWVPPKRCTGYIREGRSVDPEQLELSE